MLRHDAFTINLTQIPIQGQGKKHESPFAR
jgi:hypothetical protein